MNELKTLGQELRAAVQGNVTHCAVCGSKLIFFGRKKPSEIFVCSESCVPERPENHSYSVANYIVGIKLGGNDENAITA